MRVETESQAQEMADAFGIGKCPKCGIVSSDPENHCKEEVRCCVCNGECEMDTEYEGSAICKDANCSVHKEAE